MSDQRVTIKLGLRLRDVFLAAYIAGIGLAVGAGTITWGAVLAMKALRFAGLV